MHAELVDPRDVQWEVDEPCYRVHFWTEGSSAEYQLAGAGTSAFEILTWAETERRARGADGVEVFALVDYAGLLGAVRLTPSS